MNAATFPLSADQRSALRKAIVAHDGWSDYRARAGVTSDSMTVGDLFAAAEALGLDVSIITGATATASGDDMSDEHHKPRPYDAEQVKALTQRFYSCSSYMSGKDAAFLSSVLGTIDSKQDGRATERQYRCIDRILTRAEKKAADEKAAAEAKALGDMFNARYTHDANANASASTATRPATSTTAAAAFVPAAAPATAPAGDPAHQLAALIAQMAGQSLNPETVARIVDERITAALAGIPSVKIECKGTDGATRTIDGHQHPRFKALLTAAASRNVEGHHPNIWLAGPAGSGKTYAGKMIAKAMGLPFVFNGALANAFELLGFIDAGGTYHRTAFREAFENGGVYMFDEVDGSDNSALLALNAALANGAAQFPDGRIERHPDCVILASANTWGLGATAEYVGRSKIDAAFLDRFGVRFDWQYDTALETAISGNEAFARRVIAARERARQAGLKVLITPRASQAGAALIAAGMSEEDAAGLTYLANLTADQRRIVEG
jgi:cobaltochelatase CobS